MKKILVPTDFSPVADNAILYAIEIAAKFKSELYFYHVYSLDRFNYDLNFSKHEQPFTKKMEQKMNHTAMRFKDKTTQYEIAVQTHVELGDIFSLFSKTVEKHAIDLIIMGSQGATGLKKVIFGSAAAMALDMAEVPVLVVPPKHSFCPLEHIILATDHNGIGQNVVTPLQKLASRFGAKVTVLNVKTGPPENIRQKSSLSFAGVETTYCEVPMTKSINESINEFIRKEGCDLLCMVRREKGFFESIFKKSITKAQVFNSKVPLLVVPEK